MMEDKSHFDSDNHFLETYMRFQVVKSQHFFSTMVNIFEGPQIFLVRVHSYSTFPYCLRIPFVRCCHLLNLIFMFAGLIDFFARK